MSGIENYTTFLITGILLNLTPGQDTMYIIGRSIAQGRKAGIASALGIGTGTIVHTVAAAFGLSAILMTSSSVFEIIKYLGAAYLFYLGIQMIFKKQTSPGIETDEGKQLKISSVYKKGILTNILNPKVALFFLAFLPQFIDPSNNYGMLPFIILGLTFVTTGTLWCIIVAVFSSAFSAKLRKNLYIKKILDKLCGILFIGLGIKMALQKR
jgi:RhtB (resistance to homoserine/threonine) family protein